MSTDFFGAFKYNMTRLTYSGGLITPSGAFYNGVWADFSDAQLTDGQFLFIAFESLYDPISILYNNSLYETLVELEQEIIYRGLLAQFIPPLVENEDRQYIGKILITTRNPLYPATLETAFTYTLVDDEVTELFVASVNNSPQSSVIQGCIQPLNGSETMVLPEGLRDREVYSLWTITKLNIVGDRTEPQGFGTYLGDNADKIIVNDAVYTVYTAKPWVYVPVMGAIGGVSQYQYYITRYQPLYSLESVGFSESGTEPNSSLR